MHPGSPKCFTKKAHSVHVYVELHRNCFDNVCNVVFSAIACDKPTPRQEKLPTQKPRRVYFIPVKGPNKLCPGRPEAPPGAVPVQVLVKFWRAQYSGGLAEQEQIVD